MSVEPRPVIQTATTARAHRDLVENTKAPLNSRFRDDLRLSDIARLVNSSPFHLGRIFRSAVGQTLHAYRDRIRLRVALERILDGCGDGTVRQHWRATKSKGKDWQDLFDGIYTMK